MKKLFYATFILSLFFMLTCQQQQDIYDLEKIDTRQQLDEMLAKIDNHIEDRKLDTLQLEESELEQELVQAEKELQAMRDTVLNKINRLDEIQKKDWEKFSTEIDSTIQQVNDALEMARSSVSTITQEPPTVPPSY
mgnify:CR=1 FL=1